MREELSRWRSGTLKINEAVDAVAVRKPEDVAKDEEAKPNGKAVNPKANSGHNGEAAKMAKTKAKNKDNGEARTKAVDAATIEDNTADAVALAQLTSEWR